MEIIIAIILNLNHGEMSIFIESLAYALSISSIVVYALIFFVFIYVILLYDKRKFTESHFSEIFIQDLRTETVFERSYHLFQMIKRLVYIVITQYANHMIPLFQIACLYYLSVITLIYYGICAPLSVRLDRRFDMMNEFIFGLAVISLITSTEWIPDSATRFLYSWSIIILT